MEYPDFSISKERTGSLPVIVDSIYYVFADKDYRIWHPPIPDSLVLITVLSGQGIIEFQDRSFPLSHGDYLLFDASEEPFSYHCTGLNWDFWWFEFRCTSPDFIGIPQETIVQNPLNNIHLYLCDEALYRLKQNDKKTASTMLGALLCLLNYDSHNEPHVHREVDLFRKADRYIRRNLATATVESTAQYLQISERTLLTIFQNILGVRTVEYIQQIKNEIACHLLQQDFTVKSIAEKLGYADQFSFNKSFKKNFGCSPTQYKKRNFIQTGKSPGAR